MSNQRGPIFTASDLQSIRYNENGESLVNLKEICPDILCDYRRNDSNLDIILVRKSIVDRLQKVQRHLTLYDASMRLLVVEGYRSPTYQERYYLKQLLIQHENHPTMDFELLLEHVHQFVALPSVAGHPTGGAIDLTIVFEGQEIDMGGEIADFSIPERLSTHSLLVNPEQAQRRLLLHDLMLGEGFAAFYGEWWHFSYGDREWAAFYNKPEALYSPIF
ncbi:MAG: M15 family metallopeptidase [Chlamydiales bacterium]